MSYAQLKAALWNRSGARVHAVVDGLVLPGLPQRLAEAEVTGFDCIERGALSPQQAARAAYVAELRADSPFTDWLLGEAVKVHPGWGVVMITSHSLLQVREHCRSLAQVATPEGERRALRWWDAEVLCVLLPALRPSQLDEFFGIGQTLVLPARDAWTWHAMEQGTLATTQRRLMSVAA